MFPPQEPLPLRRSDGIEIHDMQTEYVLHDIINKKVHVLNRTAYYIWDHCDGITTLSESLELMRRQWPDVPEETLAKDIENALDNLRREQLVESGLRD